MGPLVIIRTFFISSEVGLSDQVDQVDIRAIPEAVSKAGFAKVDYLNDVQDNRVVIDLETTGLSKNTYNFH